ncbi:MAG: SsrA-binding protein SmpB [Phycisphaerae bacterium]
MSKKKDKSSPDQPRTARILNRRARHEYHILEVVECGMELVGTEVKSLRAGQAKIDEAYARVRSGQAYLVGANIATYPMAAAAMQHDPTRDRRLLLHRRQIDHLQAHALQKGNTLVPLAVYFKDGWAKCELGLAVGKRQFDKRQDIKKRDQQRDIAREMNRRKRGK